jgi:uncharacterized protein (DUF2236 family)
MTGMTDAEVTALLNSGRIDLTQWNLVTEVLYRLARVCGGLRVARKVVTQANQAAVVTPLDDLFSELMGLIERENDEEMLTWCTTHATDGHPLIATPRLKMLQVLAPWERMLQQSAEYQEEVAPWMEP